MARGGALASPPGNIVKCFLCCKYCLKSHYTEYFCIILRKCRQPPDSHWGSNPGPRWGTSVLQTPSLPTPGKNPAGAHGYNYSKNNNACNVNVCGVLVIVKSQIKSYVEIFQSFWKKLGANLKSHFKSMTTCSAHYDSSAILYKSRSVNTNGTSRSIIDDDRKTSPAAQYKVNINDKGQLQSDA